MTKKTPWNRNMLQIPNEASVKGLFEAVFTSFQALTELHQQESTKKKERKY